ncbi:ubiquinol oxidase subunit II [Paenibacillus hexagrammi]|uniref:Quinol oxidase subunit 2 n=1 Tax=Paenibacillus hexagrammi TaxID=2908839 RepID=A0ABY3SRY6_9BACL|nr:ubiquinol oxidase subunit II [Paenibacillus sp. YPD9-1]UJF35875.1 ubiquinol oxidase subunit II [Paenibacillus sp. YPD9-1]
MNKSKKWITRALPLLTILMLVILTGCSHQAMVLDPKGPIGESQKDLIYISSIFCAVILVPVLALTAWIVWRYRDSSNNKAPYQPNWSHNTLLETIWWAIPIIIIVALGVVTVKYTYALEPSKPIASSKKPITVQVTSLDWKWLFLYPEQGIATVNYLQIPEDTPVKFELTSDAPMNSFWVPQLGGQIYTMSGMAMTLYLQADEPGHYFGTGANFSGEHFADMTFDVNATSEQEFDTWVAEVKKTNPALSMEQYETLAKPASSKEQFYSSFPSGLFQYIVTKYSPNGQSAHSGHMNMNSEQMDMSKQEKAVEDVTKPQEADYEIHNDQSEHKGHTGH